MAPRYIALALAALLSGACTNEVDSTDDAAEANDPPQPSESVDISPLAHPLPGSGPEACRATVLPIPRSRLRKIVIIECPQPYFDRGDPPPELRIEKRRVELPANERAQTVRIAR